MSMVQDIENMIFDKFCDGEVHTVDEIRKTAVEMQIISSSNTSAVRNTFYKLKDDSRIEMLGKGKYIFHSNAAASDRDYTVEQAFLYLSRHLRDIKKLDVINNSKEELEKGKIEVEIYRKYIKEFSKILNR